MRSMTFNVDGENRPRKELLLVSSSSLMSVLVYMSQLLVEESEVMERSLSLCRCLDGKLSLIHFSISSSCDAGSSEDEIGGLEFEK